MISQKKKATQSKKRIPQGPARRVDQATFKKFLKENIQKYDKVLRRLADK